VVLGVALLLAAGCGVANPFAPANASAKQKAQETALKWAQCMRQHGVNVPDPGPNGSISVQRGSDTAGKVGGVTAGGGVDPQSQQFQDAMNACKRYQPTGAQGAGPPSQQMLDNAAKFAQCMRDHGVPMEDPQVSGGGVRVGGGSNSIDPSSDQFKQAQQACQHYMDKALPKQP